MKKINFDSIKKEFNTAKYFFKLTNKLSKSYAILVTIAAIFQSITPVLNIIMPKYIIDELINSKRFPVFIILVSITVLGNFLVNVINHWMNKKIDIANHKLFFSMELHLGKKIMKMDYENLEDPEILDQKEKAMFPITNLNALWRMFNDISSIMRTVIILLSVIAIITTLNFGIIAVIILIILFNIKYLLASQKKMFEMNQELIPFNRRFVYYINTVNDYSMAKEVRIYHMIPYLMNRLNNYIDEVVTRLRKGYKILGRYNALSYFNLQIQSLLVYAYMAWCVYHKKIGIGSFTMYVNAASTFSNNLFGLYSLVVDFRLMCRYLEEFVKFENLPEHKGENELQEVELNMRDDIKIEFKNVYFKYPRAEEYILKNINLEINKYDKISIVGKNGAGKTTFIKLLCRLYKPNKGEILINGVNINFIKQEDYIQMLSTVFQDFKLYAFTIVENICFDGECNQERLREVLKQVGVLEKVNSLEKGINTSLYKFFDPNGIELSGGENQKVAIGRAIYRDTPIIILDEPTAALDPYAEYEIFSKLNEIADKKTAIFISHRLSSCKFSNKIIVFDKGEVVEQGTHDELVKASGLYSEMWGTQAQYYM